MSSVLKEQWFWIIILSVCMVIATPLLVIWIILQLPFPYNLAATFILVIIWGIVAGYKEWIIEKRKEKEKVKA